VLESIKIGINNGSSSISGGWNDDNSPEISSTYKLIGPVV